LITGGQVVNPLITLLRRATDMALGALLPQQCAGCGCALAGGELLCTECLDAIPELSFAVCARCLAAGRSPVGCVAHAHFAVWPAWVYDRRAEEVVHALKFGGRAGLAAGLGRVLARAARHLGAADLVTEVPLHHARRRERGYNQASLLADALGGALGVPRAPGLLVRTRATRAQARLGARERRLQMGGAFHVARPGWARGRRVVVVDDVITSGATLEACLAALTEAQARPVAVTLAWAQ
jgi:ComF family protein